MIPSGKHINARYLNREGRVRCCPRCGKPLYFQRERFSYATKEHLYADDEEEFSESKHGAKTLYRHHFDYWCGNPWCGHGDYNVSDTLELPKDDVFPDDWWPTDYWLSDWNYDRSDKELKDHYFPEILFNLRSIAAEGKRPTVPDKPPVYEFKDGFQWPPPIEKRKALTPREDPFFGVAVEERGGVYDASNGIPWEAT